MLDAEYHPPAAHGDVLRAALRRPRAIGLVDGLFERVPSVWHKEILFAISEGVPVYGAASLGALRAAELDCFGMRGVGVIYRAYVDGELEDDDEVAVAHGGAEDGYRTLSEAMVDVRATLEAAAASGIVTAATAAAVAARVKAMFYPERSLVNALDAGDPEHDRLRAWLPGRRVERKHDDALALLRAMRDDLETGLAAPRPAWTFQPSRYWEEARRAVEATEVVNGSPLRPTTSVDEELEAVLDEARLDPEQFRRLLDEALLTALARQASTTAGVDASSWARQVALDEERLREGLLDPKDVDEWLSQRGLVEGDLPAVARRLAVLRWARLAHREAVIGELTLTLRTGALYADLAKRAARKSHALAVCAEDRATTATDEEVVSWYFRERLARDAPEALHVWATTQGWRGAGDLLRALRAEWRYLHGTPL